MGAHALLLTAGLAVNLCRFVAGALTWPATGYTVITGVCLVAALLSFVLPLRTAVLFYGIVGTAGILWMSALSTSFPWLFALLPSGILAFGDAFGVRVAAGYALLSVGASSIVAVVFHDPGAGLALVGLSLVSLTGIVVMQRLAVDNIGLRQKLECRERELGDINIAIEIFANGRSR